MSISDHLIRLSHLLGAQTDEMCQKILLLSWQEHSYQDMIRKWDMRQTTDTWYIDPKKHGNVYMHVCLCLRIILLVLYTLKLTTKVFKLRNFEMAVLSHPHTTHSLLTFITNSLSQGMPLISDTQYGCKYTHTHMLVMCFSFNIYLKSLYFRSY